jgi:hypothetical protein
LNHCSKTCNKNILACSLKLSQSILLIKFFSLKTSQANRMSIKYHLKIESSQSLRTNWTRNCFSFTQKKSTKNQSSEYFCLFNNFLAFRIQKDLLLWIYAFFNVSEISLGIKFIYSIYFYDSINPQHHKSDFISFVKIKFCEYFSINFIIISNFWSYEA